MRIGVIGLGKLGLPVAVSMAMKGHEVLGYDHNPARMNKNPQDFVEVGPDGYGDFNEILANAEYLSFTDSLNDIAAHSEIIFLAIQTPHDPKFEGVTPLPEERKDFDYSFLKTAVRDLMKVVRHGTLVVVISTCLPGTMRREILPMVPKGVDFIYNPFFIAMGTVMKDFLHPEFVLIGADDRKSAHKLVSFYRTVIERNCEYKVMSIESAELTKVAYNTYISFKIGFVNLLMEICDRFAFADVDDVTGALKCASDRLISPAYLNGGMGDGGGCHPRDNIAMSWLARDRGLSFDLFEAVMQLRENQARWLASMMVHYRNTLAKGLDLVIYGMAFKPGTRITTGSSALLVHSILKQMGEKVILMDPVIAPDWPLDFPAVVLLGCNHPGSDKIEWPQGSIVIDPFRVVPEQDGVTVHGLGEGVSFDG